MSVDTLSFSVRIWRDPCMGVTCMQVMRVDEGTELRFRGGKFVLRVKTDAERVVTRCTVRHIPSGREVHVQGGLGLGAFIRDCLLQDVSPELVQVDEAGG